ncbi:hypothetical protein Cch01nite_33980 [Cellulomonas chitinilytica]|uniref:Polysaccharide pyruvyl transferase domain-containing protein n=1 Tax=Cellulomonas chitinilytica TaxID=398759 RepID=A0A919U416_9CELL|nr:polysaccharide pyruvyl transferase family protein [Cellulomonas chitinilytica]GIG22674.1 hypothetical protein Cch01nite_33980 [Cellulomonas chitinilytica]
MVGRTTPWRAVFLSLTGQDDNIGDVVLRRRLLHDVAGLGRCHALVVGQSAGYVDGLAAPPGVALYSSRRRWGLALLAALCRGRVLHLGPAGEVHGEGRGDREGAVRLLRERVIDWLRRRRGSRFAWVGVGARNPSDERLAAVRRLALVASPMIWRDAESSRVLGGTTGPDWAFGEDGRELGVVREPGPRDVLAVSLRSGGSGVSDAWVDGVRLACRRLSLRPLTFVQVRRDGPVNEELAARLGGEHLPWPADVEHRGQEVRVRAQLSTAALVLSDRLHALILGTTEGAVPVSVFSHPDLKIGRSMAAAGIDGVSADASGMSADEVADFLCDAVGRRAEILGAAADAAQRVRGYGGLLADPAAPRTVGVPVAG